MRLIDADELMEHVWRDRLDSRELIAKMIDNAPTVKEISTKIPINVLDQLILLGSKTKAKSEEQRWTPVSEDLPEEGKAVIASTDYGVYPEARFTKEYGWEWAYEAGADYWRPLACVQAWMSLPKQYSEEDI